ncbi:MAG: [NiFe] hydrogenase metallocenter assembly protein HypF [Myxococcales bacterium]|nr:[NiFe] hydrogenase metallocenter assembly protein HypF [Myxococcales bacterium]
MVARMEGPVGDRERRALRIRGVVQGVGFRPAIYRVADALGLAGFVQNDREGVWVEIEGGIAELDRFTGDLERCAPPASRIDCIETMVIEARRDHGFRIAESPAPVAGSHAAAAIPADLAPCEDCLRELGDPEDRRYRYPFINCTACGPRFTIVRDVPYDRSKTTMAPFAMCAACLREYGQPANRRFHAEPNACPACGPQVQLVAGGKVELEGDRAVIAAAAAIANGAIVAIKGAGGFVLAADATSEAAVMRLRQRKRRLHKPFAVMGRSLEHLEGIAALDDATRKIVCSPHRPIVLVPSLGVVAPAVAPGLADIGVYLPPTPLQHLLLADGPPLQVMTSGNVADEPIARTDAEAFERLDGIAFLFVIHDREIHTRADDSVVRSSSRGPIPIRRARGIVPESITLPVAGPPVLAVGGHERNTVCLVHGGQAVLSQHIGDLDHPESDTFFREAIAHLQELAGVEPEAIAHDLHPDYRSTRWALASHLPLVAVQHHHAHVASCLAEHGRSERVIGVAFDGTGLGDDAELWGGEILDADLGTSHRLGHLRAIALAGGEAAIREPWRLAAAALIDAGESLDLLPYVSERDRARRIRALLATSLPAPATGAGRWFDAVAALLGVGRDISYDGQAAAQLEALAAPMDASPFEIAISGADPFEIDLRPTICEIARELRQDTAAPILAARFHATVAFAILEACRRSALRTVALTGGCFQNRRLLEQTAALLEGNGYEVLVHRRVPPNDGGLALGQAAVASFRLAARSSSCV